MGRFEFSPYLDVKVPSPSAAADFYIRHFGWTREDSDSHQQTLKFGPLTIFLTPDEGKNASSNVHFEMSTTENIESVKATLESAGCTSCTSGMRNAYMFTDPYGNHFHIYQVQPGTP